MFDAAAEQRRWEQDQVAPPTEEELDFLDRDMHHWVPGFPESLSGKMILDLGAGRGLLGALLAQRHSPKGVISFDLGLHRLRSTLEQMRSLPNFSLLCGNVFQMPFPDESFDFVLANSLLHHFPELEAATKEIARVLKPGGSYIGREPNFDNPVVRTHVFRFSGTWIRRYENISENEYPLRPAGIRAAFASAGCSCHLHFFWRRFKALHHPKLSIAMSVQAQRLG